jgi:hypothetical protein
MKTFDATVVATITMSVQAPSFVSAMDKVRDAIPSSVLAKNSNKLLYAISIEDIHLTEVSIMDGSTSHSPRLVELINQCYVERQDLLFEVVRLLAQRDRDEFDDSIDANTASIKDIAYHYLHAIADDQDLITIINYCRL